MPSVDIIISTFRRHYFQEKKTLLSNFIYCFYRLKVLTSIFIVRDSEFIGTIFLKENIGGYVFERFLVSFLQYCSFRPSHVMFLNNFPGRFLTIFQLNNVNQKLPLIITIKILVSSQKVNVINTLTTFYIVFYCGSPIRILFN